MLFNSGYLNSSIFSNNYKPVHTNISSLSDAEIIILPEIHYYEDDQIRNAWIINTLYRTGDVVLVESPRDEDETYHQIKSVCRPITIRGWDCPESDEALHNAKQPFYDLRDRLFAIKGFGKEHRKILSEAITQGPCKTDEVFQKQFLSDLDDFNHVEPNVKKALLLRHIGVWHEQNGDLGRVLAGTFSKRQASLIQKCHEFSKTNNRVFIIAGATHAISEACDDRPYVREGVQLLHGYLKEKKFVIFDYARHPTNLLRADVKLSLMISSMEKTVKKVCGCASPVFFFFLFLFTFPISVPCYLLYTRNR